MQISLPVKIEKVSTDVIDDTELFKVYVHRNYAPNLLMQFAGNIYQNVGGLLEIPVWSADNIYSLGALVWKAYTLEAGSGIHKVTAVGEIGLVPKQPHEYLDVDLFSTTPLPSAWVNRYVKLNNAYTHLMTMDWTSEDGSIYHELIDHRQLGGYITHRRTVKTGTDAGKIYSKDVPCVSEVSNYDKETVMYSPNDANYEFNWFISIDNVLYARTWCPVEIDYIETTSPAMTFTAISHIEELGPFAKVRPTLDNAPLDAKHYSTAIRPNTMGYVIDCFDTFDTLALGNIIGDTVTVLFKEFDETEPDNYRLVYTETDYPLQNSRDVDGVLNPYRTTAIIYSDTVINFNGRIEITVTGNNIELGTIMAGLNVNGGFTNLEFGNSFKDYSPYEKDNWGNITYIDGVRVQVHNGTVDISVTEYDMMNRLITSIGGNTVILNGSDTLDNTAPNGSTTFASTMIIGRWKVSGLKTKIKDTDIAQYCSYTFTIEEQV